MDTRVINTGPVTSFNSLVFHLSNEFLKIRKDYISGIRTKICFDFSEMRGNAMNLPALAALLATGKKISDFIGYSIPVKMQWNPQVLTFLTDTHFMSIAKKLKIFEFDPLMSGTMRFNNDYINPNTRIIYFGDIKPINNIPIDQIGLEKAKHKQKIIGNLKVRASNIFGGVDDRLETSIVNTTLELIINSLMHAEEVAFVALQRTSKRITISVCDAGIGFKKSLYRTTKYDHFEGMSHAQAVFIGSLIQKDVHGLRLAISEVLRFKENSFDFKENKGWVVISSFDSEIRWQKDKWAKALSYFDSIDISKEAPDLDYVFNEPIKSYVTQEEVEKGYYKTYDHFLIGTRISFEIKF